MQLSAAASSMMRGEKKSYSQDITGSNLQKGRQNRIQQGTEPVPSTSGVSEITAFPLAPIADDPAALPSPSSSPSSSQQLFLLFTHASPCMLAVVLCYCTFQGTVL